MLFTSLYGPPPMSEFTSYLRELPALPQGRWFICALGGGSDADALKALLVGIVLADSFTD